MSGKQFIRIGFAASLLTILIVMIGCAGRDSVEGDVSSDDFMTHYRPPMVDMSDVMQAKLLHTQAMVEGLALGDLRQVAVNAEMLHDLSERATWMVHDTVAYITMSNEFRTIVDEIARHAREQKLETVIESYTELTQSCIACHAYLRKQRLEKEMPGTVTMLRLLD